MTKSDAFFFCWNVLTTRRCGHNSHITRKKKHRWDVKQTHTSRETDSKNWLEDAPEDLCLRQGQLAQRTPSSRTLPWAVSWSHGRHFLEWSAWCLMCFVFLAYLNKLHGCADVNAAVGLSGFRWQLLCVGLVPHVEITVAREKKLWEDFKL